jgi:hypothetical protein
VIRRLPNSLCAEGKNPLKDTWMGMKFIKSQDRKIQREAWWGLGRSWKLRERVSALQVLLKPRINYGKGRTKTLPYNDQCVGKGVGSSQPSTVGLGHPWATYMSPKPFLLPTCLGRTSL